MNTIVEVIDHRVRAVIERGFIDVPTPSVNATTGTAAAAIDSQDKNGGKTVRREKIGAAIAKTGRIGGNNVRRIIVSAAGRNEFWRVKRADGDSTNGKVGDGCDGIGILDWTVDGHCTPGFQP